MGHEPIYEISGKKRREEKKRLSHLKSVIKNYWYFHQIDKDMASIYGSSDGYPMSDTKAKERYNEIVIEIQLIEKFLIKKM